MGRFARSWALTKESYAILKQTPELAIFPILSGIACIVLGASFAVPLFLSLHFGHSFTNVGQAQQNPLYYLVLFAFYCLTSFVVIFFNAGLVSCAYDRLRGEPTSFKKGLTNASKHMGSIIGWSILSATVGLLLRLISERMGLIGRIVIALLGAAWAIAVYFVVPIIVIEGKTPVPAIKNSTAMLKKTWGERLIGGSALGLVTGLFVLLGLVPVAVGIALLVTSTALLPLAIALFFTAVLYWILMAVVSSALAGIFNTAVYVYAASGQVPSAFTADYVQAAFREKPARKGVFGAG